ncbi:hypothetical protein BABINDRAFT_163284 [Babjeviella inositovora NRRL Y-12698]|uniref:Enhancer of mRNA-decapping protein 3 n=1 Tax=Babjeviella inositovora NRRL Y-12698 TaxID=984486 RepID=A0A1E3QJP5_9ASCO|nr:uncharacterized protein BABINDRAFT_163284 [Babjeviella inositovora NRRL Y-12698]ODQ77913.1 hypothetical protein BABINDRAFT_163284 [Babjeviella inositovora NRRL Y-12698]
MSDFANYTVELFLKDNQRVGGTVAHVADQKVTLSDAKFLPNGSHFPTFTVEGTHIQDLKVVSLPANMKRRKAKTKTTLDDAIVFSSATIPSPEYPPAKQLQAVNTSNRRKNARGPRATLIQDDPDWDTDVSESVGTDFDFSSNLRKFDKHRVFEELRASDTVAHSDRLVGHNKLDSPKTKYENTEMVLNLQTDGWDSNGNTRASTPSKKDLLAKRGSKASVSEASSANLRKLLHGKEEVPVCSPIQLLEIERLSIENYKLSAEIMAENAAVNLQSVVVGILGGSSRLASSNHNAPPLVVLLVGNNRAGIRTLACGRHLSNRGVRSVAFLLNSGSNNASPDRNANEDEELDSHLRYQLSLFKLFGGRVFNQMGALTSFLKSLDSPVELIVDGLQGFDSNISDLWGADLKLCTGLITWTNQQACGKLSIDIPSGLDPGSGQLTLDDLRVESKWVVSCGLPLNGLLQAYRLHFDTQWIHFLVDIGVPTALYKKGSFRKFDRVWFTDAGVAQLSLS